MPESLKKIIDDAINAAPRWIFTVALLLISLLFTYSLITGNPVYFFGQIIGRNDPPQNKQNQGFEIIQPVNQLEWEQRKYVADAARLFAIENKEAIEIIGSCFPKFKSSSLEVSQKVITKDEAREIIENPKQQKLLLSIQSFLNSLEGVSSAYQNGVADKDMFEISFKMLIARWYGRLQGFIEVYKERCQCTWTPFEEVGNAWKDKTVTIQSGKGLGECLDYNKPA